MPHPLTHGIDTYFAEFAGNRRRVALVLIAVSAVLSALMVFMGRRVTEEIMDDPRRFGFEGPKQWVERIRLEQLAEHEQIGQLKVTYLTTATHKGSEKKSKRVDSDPAA